MSYLREIMQRLTETRSGEARGPAPAGGEDPGPRLEEHLRAYEERLGRCTPAMLRYEWAWLEEHIEALELCLSQPEMVSTAGGSARVQVLLAESGRFRERLRQCMEERSVETALHRGTLVSTEHAWELTHPAIRAQWGIDPVAETGPDGG